MKIALFPPSLEGGGVQRVVLNLARGFAESGLETDLVLIKSAGELLSQVPERVNVVDLKARRALTGVYALSRYLREARPDVLFAASEPVNLAAIWARMLARVNTKIAVSVLNTPSVRQANVLYQRERLYPFLTRWFYPRADYIIAVAESIRQDLATYIHLPPERIKTIYTPVITRDLYERADRPVEHPWFHDDDDTPVILGVGRFVPQKDLATLIRAFAKVRKQRPARLVILGDGQERPRLEALVAKLELTEHVSLPGFMDNLPFMKRTHVFVLSSIFEGLPTVLIEALALSPALVSTDCPGGIREILDDGRYGTIVPMQDPSALAQAIIAALDDPPDVALLRRRAEDFSVERIIPQYREYLALE